MEILQLKQSLKKNIAILPGSRNRDGGPILIFPSQGEWKEFPYQEIVAVLGYLAQIPEDKTRARGFTVIVDMRNGWIRYLKSILRACQHVLFGVVRQVLIVKPEQFLEKQKISLDLMIEAYDLKVSSVSIHKLSRHVDITQLPPFLGGTYPYDNERWIDIREKYEDFIKEGSSLLRKIKGDQGSLDESSNENGETSSGATQGSNPGSVDSAKVVDITRKGQSLLSELNEQESGLGLKVSNPEFLLAFQRVETLLRQIKERQEMARNSYQEKEKEEKSQKQRTDRALFEQFSEGVDNVCDWLLGPGEKWLLTLHEIGESRDEAEQLVREHDQLETKAHEVGSQVRDLKQMAEKLAETEHPRISELRKKKEHLNSVWRTFVSRVQRQKEMVQMSTKFHQQLDAISSKLDQVLEELLSDLVVQNAQTAQNLVDKLDAKLQAIDKTYHEVLATGQQFLEQLKMTEQNGLGREVTRDYSAGVVQVRLCLNELTARKQRCEQLADGRRLRLKQYQQLYTCEKDAEQAIDWIEELTGVLNQQMKIGKTPEERAQIRQDQHKLEHTARSSYEYGRQLLHVSMLLRRTLRLEFALQMTLSRRLDEVWAQFCRAYSERVARLSIGSTFYNNVKEINERLENLCGKVGEEVRKAPDASNGNLLPLDSGTLDRYDQIRKQLGLEVKELRSMAETLIQNMDPAPATSKSRSEELTTEIQDRIRQVEMKQRRLERYWMEPANYLVKDVHLSDVHVAVTPQSPIPEESE